MSRLDRLVVLLETGLTPFIRSTAAEQLSDLAKGHPEEILSLLGRVYPFLKASKWETRIAAAKAFGGVVAHAPQWDPNEEVTDEGPVEIKQETGSQADLGIKQESPGDYTGKTEAEETGTSNGHAKVKVEEVDPEQEEELRRLEQGVSRLVSFATCDMPTVLKLGRKLLALGGQEYEKAKKAKAVKTELKPGASARLKAMQKRRAKAKSARLLPVDLSQSLVLRQLDEEQPRVEHAELTPLLQQHAKVAGVVWPFQGVYELLLADLFAEKWEVRHGSALGLRELIRAQGLGAGRVLGRTRAQNGDTNRATLEDLAVSLCTLFAVDRFADYVNDTVVAPVRELGAQALAALLLHCDGATTVATFQCLERLVMQAPPVVWEAMHGGMLGIRYLVSVRTDVLLAQPALFDSVVQMVLHCLGASADDVQSVAALTLAPVAGEFVRLRTASISALLRAVWGCLGDFDDDLSAAIGSVMDLLAKLCTHPEVIAIMQQEASRRGSSFEHLVPRLFPFLRHSITNVRRAALTTLREFLSIEDPKTKRWITLRAVRLLFQNLLVEQNRDVLALLVDIFDKVLAEASPDLFTPHLAPLLTLVMTPIGIARHNYHMNTALLKEDEPENRKRKADVDDLRVNIDAPVHNGDVAFVGLEVFVETRLAAATAYGAVLAHHDLDEIPEIIERLASCLVLAHATPRLFAATIIEEYARRVLLANSQPHPAVLALASTLTEVLSQPENLPFFRELSPTLKSVRTACLQLFDVLLSKGKLPQNKIPQLPVVVQGEAGSGPGAFGPESALKLVEETYPKLVKSLLPANRLAASRALEDCKHRITVNLGEARLLHAQRATSVLAAFAAAVLALSGPPQKLSPVIRCLMDSAKQETVPVLQQRLARSLGSLIQLLISLNKRAPVAKIVKNLCGFICVDTSEVPEYAHNAKYVDNILSLRKEEAKTDPEDVAAHEQAVQEAKVMRQGALLVMDEVLGTYQDRVFDEIPKLKEIMFDPLRLLEQKGDQSVIDALGVLRALLPKLSKGVHSEIIGWLPLLLHGLQSQLSVFRYSAAKCFATVCSVIPSSGFPYMVDFVLPMLKNAGAVRERQGAIEAVYHVATLMGTEILPYIVFLIVPVLGRMSDADPEVRILASTTFAQIIKLVPLEAGIPDPPDMPERLLEGRERERDFIQQMMDPTKIQPFEVPVAVKATLRKYQQEGVNWLAFLNKYHLHGILCDDMGLGKTLQTICIIASDHHTRAETGERIPSLIVCPPSLTGHWEQEFNQYCSFMKVIVYAGGPAVRAELRGRIAECDVVVTSYDVCRNDIDSLATHQYNYCVLDEGHIIKNSALKLTRCVKRIMAEHRLILSGTPIQNNVLELWSLFDFLMPGFLGTEKIFQEKFAKPIAASRNSKTSSKEQEAGALALESLHRQVLPFMLRRLKEDVLQDLPPKIIQDYYCELSELQKMLYKDFAEKQKLSVKEEILDAKADGSEPKSHIFQALQYMRKLCNHPALVVTANHPSARKVNAFLDRTKSTLRSIEHAPKLRSLRTLLLECGIGTTDSEYLKTENVISNHRALIFCQLKDMLDIVEDELLKQHMPSVTYMRLDGSTDPMDRQSIVRKFNEDPLIDVLLLTTKVGGLGLNLTGADTVIFVEHDWNPMNDLQAMDRAHRLGQKKVVNVYRLITKATLEEKIMSLQKFKMNVASTIVNQQNAGLASMDTNQLLDLFDVDDAVVDNGPEKKDIQEDLTGVVPSDAVGELGQLWDESQYEDEYNLDNFIKNLK